MTERPLVFAYNAHSYFYLVTNCLSVSQESILESTGYVFWLILGIINGVLLLNRVTPFTGPDLHLITDALKIAKISAVAGVVGIVS